MQETENTKIEDVEEVEIIDDTATPDDMSPELKALFNSEHVYDGICYSEVNKEYLKFTEDWVSVVDDISAVVDTQEVQDISETIKQFQERLEGIKEVNISNLDKTTDKAISKLSAIPFLSKFIEKESEEAKERTKAAKSARDLLQEMFDTFKDKSIVLEDAYEKSFKLHEALTEKHISLEKFSTQVKFLIMTTGMSLDKPKILGLGSQVEASFGRNANKMQTLKFITQLIEEQLTIISQQMPGIEASLIEDTDIGMFLSTMGDMNKVFKSLNTLSNTVGKASADKVMGLIVDVNDDMQDSIDFDHIASLATSQQKFLGAMAKSQEKKVNRDQENYARLLHIGQEMNNQAIAYNQATKKIMIGTEGSRMRKVENEIVDSIVVDAELEDGLEKVAE